LEATLASPDVKKFLLATAILTVVSGSAMAQSGGLRVYRKCGDENFIGPCQPVLSDSDKEELLPPGATSTLGHD
jgi:hypothetical protein